MSEQERDNVSEFTDLEDATTEEINDRMEFSDQLRNLAADVVAGRVKTIIMFRYEHDNPHEAISAGFYENAGARRHMLYDVLDYIKGETEEGMQVYMIGGDEEDDA